jgi:hypothetical protein
VSKSKEWAWYNRRMNSSTPDQYDDWYEDEHSSSDIELEDDVDDLDSQDYHPYSQYSEL